MTKRAIIYARISIDHERQESVGTQIAKSRAFVERNGWTLVGEYKDVGKSGFSGVAREDFDRMLDTITAGGADVLVTRHQDRLMRNPQDFTRLMDACVKHRVTVQTYAGGVLDLSSAEGGFSGWMQTGVAWFESATKRQRINDAIDRNRRAGKRVGGGPRRFGYRPVYADPNETDPRRKRVLREDVEDAEADLIRDAAQRVLRGETLRSIANSWDAAGVTRVEGGSWRGQGALVGRILKSPHIAGLVVWQGETFDAQWPAIIDKPTHEKLVRYLSNPGRRATDKGSGVRKYLLTGLVRCGTCGGSMSMLIPGSTRTVDGQKVKITGDAPGERGGTGRGRSYACRADVNQSCARRIRIDAESLEEFVIGEVLRLWASPKARKAALADDKRHDRLVALADELAGYREDLKAAYEDLRVHKLIDLDTYKSTKATLDARVKAAESERGRLEAEAGIGTLPDPSDGWESLTDDERRGLVELLLPNGITVLPFPQGHATRPFADKAREAQRLAEVLAKRVRFE